MIETLPGTNPMQQELESPGEVVEFEAGGQGEWLTYSPDHPAMQYLDRLRATPLDYYEEKAIQEYTGNRFSSDLNRSIVDGHPMYEVKLIDSAMDKVRLPQTTVVYRGEAPEKALAEAIAPGYKFQKLGYTSTSLDRGLARGWHNSLTVLRIEVPRGTPVVVPSLDEAEILLPHGSVFEVTGAVDRGDYTEVQVKLVDQGGD